MKPFHRILFFLILFPIACSAQIRGVVKDSLTGKPIPYVSIWVENESIGTTSEEDGSFRINTNGNKTLIFSALGYEKIKKAILSENVILMVQKATELEEMLIIPRKGTKIKEIGETENSLSEAFDNAPSIDLKYFPYHESYKKTKFLKKVIIYTDTRIPEALLKLHFYKVNPDGSPGIELLQDEYRVTVKQGVGKSSFNISDLGLTMPQNGIYIGFEKLMIDDNRNQGGRFYPLVLYNRVPRTFIFEYTGGKWQKKIVQSAAESTENKVYEPAINLLLTN
ncbi:carboxypeptidase-like regulatory domain-containing protein [Flavobacterium sp.]|uniref:carboxypeptidase-like regulatory domain-containing protein n=1 Tax=Flavobacterium sp. TaxID=239 RepID=UPI0028BD42D0|nr:carboxypeptidase-like regulatory domain-containing protein [Flavobacterium sp.]